MVRDIIVNCVVEPSSVDIQFLGKWTDCFPGLVSERESASIWR
jgi:hypothetical protein